MRESGEKWFPTFTYIRQYYADKSQLKSTTRSAILTLYKVFLDQHKYLAMSGNREMEITFVKWFLSDTIGHW